MDWVDLRSYFYSISQNCVSTLYRSSGAKYNKKYPNFMRSWKQNRDANKCDWKSKCNLSKVESPKKCLEYFDINTDSLLVCDAFGASISCEIYSISTLNSCNLPVKAQLGVWDVYHVLNYIVEPIGLYMKHSASEYQSLDDTIFQSWKEQGKVFVGFSRIVAVVDKSTIVIHLTVTLHITRKWHMIKGHY